MAVHQPLVTSLEDLAVAMELADIEPVIEDVGKGGAIEACLALAKAMPFSLKLVRQTLEGMPAGGIEFEDTGHGLRRFRMRLHGLVRIVAVNVAKRSQPRRPALADLLVHAFEHLQTQIVAVVLGDSGHHVERQGIEKNYGPLLASGKFAKDPEEPQSRRSWLLSSRHSKPRTKKLR